MNFEYGPSITTTTTTTKKTYNVMKRWNNTRETGLSTPI